MGEESPEYIYWRKGGEWSIRHAKALVFLGAIDFHTIGTLAALFLSTCLCRY